MSKHQTFRGLPVDMDSMRRENERTVAVGNMKVNARGDQIDRGRITKTADEIARENHRVQSAVVNTGVKGPQPSATGVLDNKKPVNTSVKAAPKHAKPAATPTKLKETELPSGDIVVEEDRDGGV